MKAGWRIGPLENFIESFIVPQRDKPKVFEGSIPWCRIEDIDGIYLSRSKTGKVVSQQQIEEMPLRVFPKGTVMVSCSADLGRCAIVAETLVTNQTFIGLVPRQNLDPQFLYYLMTSRAVELNTAASGATITYLSKDKFKRLQTAIPDIQEQQRIVGILDEAFAGLATAKAHAEKNLQNARALFESELNAVFEEALQSCEIGTLSDLATDITDGDHLPPPKSETGVPFVTIGNIVKETRKLDFTNTFMVPRTYFDELKAHRKPRKGDVLYTVTGSFGIPVIVEDNFEFCFQRHIGLIRPNVDTNSKWLYYLLLSPQLLNQANKGATGAAQRTVSLKQLRAFRVPKVSPAEQQKVVQRLDALSNETQRLESLYQRKLAALDALKQSLLHQAFSGAL